MDWKEFYQAIQRSYNIENEEKVNKVPFSNIIEVTSQELIYKASDGMLEKILLDGCARNYEIVNGEARNYCGEKLNCVGGRFFSKAQHVAFYEFFTDKHVRFCLELKQSRLRAFLSRLGWNVYRKEYSAFYDLQKKLNSSGFTTIDLR